MSRRNPTNDRYMQEEKKTGKTRKSASSAKPSRAAAGSVYVVSSKKTKKQLKEEQRRKDDEQRRVEERMQEKYGNIKTPKIKKLRVVWWITLALAIVFTLLAWFARDYMPEWASYVTMALAYVFIIAALVVDLVFIRKERNRVERETMGRINAKGGKNKAYREEERRVKAEIREEERAAKAKAKEEAENPQPKKTMGSMIAGIKKKQAEHAEKVAAEKDSSTSEEEQQ